MLLLNFDSPFIIFITVVFNITSPDSLNKMCRVCNLFILHTIYLFIFSIFMERNFGRGIGEEKMRIFLTFMTKFYYKSVKMKEIFC